MIYRGREVQKLDGYLDRPVHRRGDRFVDRHSEKPWFLYLAYNAVHTPLEILEKHQDRIPASVTDPDRRGYASLLLGLDDAIGQLTEHLRELGPRQRDADLLFQRQRRPGPQAVHGLQHRRATLRLRGDKAQTLEGGIRVPFFVSWPGRLPAGKVYEQPVIALDILPTALARGGHSRAGRLRRRRSAAASDRRRRQAAPRRRCTGDSARKRRSAAAPGSWSTGATSRPAKSSGWQLYDLIERHRRTARPGRSRSRNWSAQLSRSWEEWNAKNVAPRWHGDRQEDPTAPARRRRSN